MIYCKNFFEPNGCTSFYIGSHNEFEDRESNHRRSCNNPNDKHFNLKVYKTIRENGGWEKWSFIHLGSKECETERQAHMIEQYEYIDIYEPDLNSIKAYLSDEDRAKYKQDWYFNKLEENNNYNIERVNKYRLKKLEENPDYYKDEYQKIKDIQNAKHICICGRKFTFGHKKRHEDTTYHKKRVNCLPCSS